MKHVLLLDLDNTLISTSPLYHRAEGAFAWEMRKQGFDPDVALARFRAYDAKMMAWHGVAIDRFPQSMVDTYAMLCIAEDVTHYANVAEECRLIGEAVFTSRALVYPKVHLTLAALANSRQYEMHIYTQGDPDVQLARIIMAGLHGYIPRVQTHVVPKKDAASLVALLDDLGQPAENCIAIGDSIPVDITPALEVGLHGAIWVSANDWMGGEHNPAALKIDHFHQLPEALVALEERYG